MPRTLVVDPALDHHVAAQDGLVTRQQALDAGYTRRAIGHRLHTRRWVDVLPGVYLVRGGEPTRRQELVAALLYAGDDAAIDGVDACTYYGLRCVRAHPRRVHVVVPWINPTRNIRYLIVRRTKSAITSTSSELIRYVDPASAVIAATRQFQSERAVVAALSEALQRRLTTYDDLVRAHVRGSPRNTQLIDDALEQVGSGIRSVSENDFRLLVEASEILPTPLYNPLLRLPTGRLVSPDALFVEAGLVHETNGRRAHEREDLFADMQERHDVMTASGLTVLHNPPQRLATRGRVAINEVERCYLRLAGHGMPEGVQILRKGAD